MEKLEASHSQGLKDQCHTLKLGNEENVKNPLTKKQQNAVFIFKHNNLNLKMETKKILPKKLFSPVFCNT